MRRSFKKKEKKKKKWEKWQRRSRQHEERTPDPKKKKEKKEEERRWNSTKKKGTKKETPVYLPSTVCWNTAPVFFFFFFFFFFMLLLLEKNSLWKEGDLFHELHWVLLSFLFYRSPGFEWCCEAAFDFRSSSFFSVFFGLSALCVFVSIWWSILWVSLGFSSAYVFVLVRHTHSKEKKRKRMVSPIGQLLYRLLLSLLFSNFVSLLF